MHRMTRSAPTEIRATFDGSSIRVVDDVATMERKGDARLVRFKPGNGKEELYRVTRVIGGRYREDFVGIDVTGEEDPARAAGKGPEMVLPASYVFSSKAWRYKGYSVLVHERDAVAPGPVWAETCIGCHNTLPYFTMLLDDLAGPDAPTFQGSITDDLLPADRATKVRIISAPKVALALDDELRHLGTGNSRITQLETQRALRRGIHAISTGFDGRHLVEEGIGCEACHGGSKAHVRDPSISPSYAVSSDAISVGHEDGTPFSRTEAMNRVCARCHTVLFSRYPWTWEGGSRKDPVPGGSSINSGEARDYLLGGCSAQMTCTTCHDPHTEDSKADLSRFDTVGGNGVCTSCHEKLAGDERLGAHTHHAPNGEGSACLNCHMPRKNMGLAYGLTRYHRIGSPTDEARVYRDRPLECSLCHADKSADDLLSTMSQWWGTAFDRERVTQLYDGRLDGSVIRRTLDVGKPHEQAVAIAVLGERGRASDACDLAQQIAHPYPLIGYFAKHALETLTKTIVPMDPGRPREELLPLLDEWCRRRAAIPPNKAH